MAGLRDDIEGLLSRCPSRFSLGILQQFVDLNDVGPSQLLQLNTILRVAREHKRQVRDGGMAWEALAIFAMYVYFQVTDVAEVGEHLCLADSTIKRWISAIYDAFNVPPGGFSSRAARRRDLRRRALEEGYISHTSWLRRMPLDLFRRSKEQEAITVSTTHIERRPKPW